MQKHAITFIASLTIATTAWAHSGVKNPQVQAWMHGMEQISAATKVLGNMARGRADYDSDAAEAAKAALVRHATDIPVLFKVQATDPKSDALPAIWEDYADFTEKAAALGKAAEQLDVSSADTIGAGMRAVGATCKSCHGAYRR